MAATATCQTLGHQEQWWTLSTEARALEKMNPLQADSAASSPVRPWSLSLAVALAVGLPLMAGIATGQFALGGLAALGALVILHIPPTATPIPMRRLLGCAVAVALCPLLGELVTAWPALTWPLFGVLIAAIVAVTRVAARPGHKQDARSGGGRLRRGDP